MDISCEKYDFKSTLKPINNAIVKTDENGAVCDFTYISNHLDLYDEQTMIDGIEILQKANVGGTRNSLCWPLIEVDEKKNFVKTGAQWKVAELRWCERSANQLMVNLLLD